MSFPSLGDLPHPKKHPENKNLERNMIQAILRTLQTPCINKYGDSSMPEDISLPNVKNSWQTRYWVPSIFFLSW